MEEINKAGVLEQHVVRSWSTDEIFWWELVKNHDYENRSEGPGINKPYLNSVSV